MPLFGLFGPPDVGQYKSAGNIRGLAKAARYRYDWVLRRDAVQALHDLGLEATGALDPQIVSALKLSLRDGHWKIREMAADALAELGAVEAILFLLPPTVDEETAVRWAAVRALERLLNRMPGSLPEEAVATLIRSLRDPAWWVREHAARAIEGLAGRIQDPRLIAWAARWLHDAVRADDYRIMRQSALNAMIALGAAPTVASLTTALRDEAWSVRISAAEALDAIHWEPTDEHLVYYWIAKGECARCTALGEAAVGPLATLLHDQYLPIQREAIRALATLGASAVPALLRALDHRDYWTRAAAIEALGLIAARHGQESIATPPLLAALQDRSKNVRRAAAQVLGAIGDGAALEQLLLLLNDHQATVREAAATALGELGDTTAAQALMHIGRRDPDWGVRRAAREALSAL
jgi:HEAT repeat protein